MKTRIASIAFLVVALGLIAPALAQTRWPPPQYSSVSPTTERAEPSEPEHAAADKSDKTGTNPLNFQRTFQFVNEFDNLGDAQINYSRFRYTEPLLGGKMSLRFEAPLVYAHSAFAGDSAVGADDGGAAPISQTTDVSRFGLGDLNFKLSYVPYVTRQGGFLTALELGVPTATADALGTGKWVVAPTATYAFFLPGNTIFAPSYKQSLSFGGDGDRQNINSGNLDFYFVWRFDKGRQWLIIDPTYILNYEKGQYSGGTVRATYGRVLGRIGGAALSGYIKPGVGIGPDRPGDWSLEIGVSVIGF